jgi:primase-polymerase (primpol)-like protein
MRAADARLAAVPADLRSLAQWVVWRFEQREDKPAKVPYSALRHTRASTTNPASWTTFEAAVAASQQCGYAGVGFVFSGDDPFCGVDLDHCLNGSGEPSEAARRIVGLLNTYTEISPSGRGLKLFVRAELPAGGNRRPGVEMYDRGRYFTVTGRHLPGTPTTLEDRQQELEALHAEIFPAPAPHRALRPSTVRSTGDDAHLLAMARSAKNGRKFMDLFYRGDLSAYHGDDSAADLALCSRLAFWCGCDPERIDRLYRQSALMREKWDSRRGNTTYGALTIGKALGARHGR